MTPSTALPTGLDAPRPALGVWLFSDAPADELVEAIVMADQAGLHEVWVADEGVSREPVAILGAAAVQTTSIRLGVGITSPLLRHPGAIASSIATVDELSGGRALLGLGIGGSLALGPFAIEIDRPVARLRQAIRVARAVITGERCEGYEPPPHAAPGRRIPIHIGARGEQLNRLASREADGVFLSGFDLDSVAAPVVWARSVRPITVGLYASARFRTPDGTPDGVDPTAITGTEDDIAEGLSLLAARHRPDVLGLALVDGRSPTVMMERAIGAFARMTPSTPPAV